MPDLAERLRFMKSKKTPKIVECKFGNEKLRWLKKEDDYALLSDAVLDRKLKLTVKPEKERKRARKTFLKSCKTVANAKIPVPFEKAPCYVPLTRAADLPLFLRMAVLALLALFDLFPGASFGVDLVADILCGFRCSSLRKVEPALDFRTDVATKNGELKKILSSIFSQLVFFTKWKGHGCKVKQFPVQDYSFGARWFIDFSRLIIKIKRKKKVYHPVAYVNSAVLVCYAEKERRDDVLKHLGDCFCVLLNCAKSSGVLTLSDKDLRSNNQIALDRFTLKTPSVAVLLRHWTESQCEEWAAEMIARAKQAIGTPDSHLINVSYDPVTLRKAVRREVLLDFLEQSEAIGLLTPEEHFTYINKVETAGNEPVLRKAEDPEVVLSTVRRFITDNPDKVAQPDEEITPKSGHVAAWRSISHEDVLIFDVNAFFPWYRSQIRENDTIDASIFKSNGFDLTILKLWAKAGIIKRRSETNPRYKYNLYASGDMNRIEVVAFYGRELLLPSEGVSASD